MKRARKAPDIPLTHLRLTDLVHAPTHSGERRLANLKVPIDILQQVHALAQQLGVTKTAALIALLNEGLQTAYRRGVGQPDGRNPTRNVRAKPSARRAARARSN